MNDGLIIPGEYREVAFLSRRPDLIEKAHSTPITKIESAIVVFRFSPGTELLFATNKDKNGTAWPFNNRIALPDCEGERARYGYDEVFKIRYILRLGVVLHEIAHIHSKETKHNEIFTKEFDSILELYYDSKHASFKVAV